LRPASAAAARASTKAISPAALARHGTMARQISAAMLEMFGAIRERCTRVMREGGAVPETS